MDPGRTIAFGTMTWRQLLNRTGDAIRAYVVAHPELADDAADPGDSTTFTVDTGQIGTVLVTVQVPIPLTASTGKVHVSVRKGASTDVDLPAP
jgi:hypothetical protein